MTEVLERAPKNASLCQQGITAYTGESREDGRSTARARQLDRRRSPTMSGEHVTCRWHRVGMRGESAVFEHPIAEITMDGDNPLTARKIQPEGLHRARSRPFDGTTDSISLDDGRDREGSDFSRVSGSQPPLTNVN